MKQSDLFLHIYQKCDISEEYMFTKDKIESKFKM